MLAGVNVQGKRQRRWGLTYGMDTLGQLFGSAIVRRLFTLTNHRLFVCIATRGVNISQCCLLRIILTRPLNYEPSASNFASKTSYIALLPTSPHLGYPIAACSDAPERLGVWLIRKTQAHRPFHLRHVVSLMSVLQHLASDGGAQG